MSINDESPIILVVGARPNFMKIYPIYAEFKNAESSNIFIPDKWNEKTAEILAGIIQ